MIRKRCLILALSVALARAAGPHPNPLETIREGPYSHPSAFDPSHAILNWNIDRGKHLDRIAATVREANAKLCIFQEVDLGARRTEGKDIAHDLAQALGMNYAFAPEFRELSQSTAGEPAYHGQAILTRLAMRRVRILRFTHQSGFWRPKPLMISSLPLFQR